MLLGEVSSTLGLLAQHYLGKETGDTGLPDPESARQRGEGVVGLCGDLDVATLLAAYGKGLYPRSTFGPQKWWAPEERMVLFLENFQIGSRIARKLASGFYRVTFDEAFEEVVEACALPRQGRGRRRWIRDDLASAFLRAHEAGVAHSVELRDHNDVLVGGAFGLAVGKVFFTEAQFSDRPDAGKIALAALNGQLQRNGFFANDAKHLSGTLCQQGFCLVPRRAFNGFLEKACAGPAAMGHWRREDDAGRSGQPLLARSSLGAA